MPDATLKLNKLIIEILHNNQNSAQTNHRATGLPPLQNYKRPTFPKFYQNKTQQFQTKSLVFIKKVRQNN